MDKNEVFLTIFHFCGGTLLMKKKALIFGIFTKKWAKKQKIGKIAKTKNFFDTL